MTHVCHAVGCTTPVPPRLLMCGRHWAMVPKALQREVWATYRHGQEVDKRPSQAYLAAAHRAVMDVFDLERAAKATAIVAPPQLELDLSGRVLDDPGDDP